MPKKKVIWIASYPRSGNTLMRVVLSALMKCPAEDIIDINVNPRKAFYDPKRFYVNNENICFIKTHSIGFPIYLFPKQLRAKIENYGFIYIYRHPLDVFLSCLNYFHISDTNKNFKSVDALKKDGELNQRINKYIDSFSLGSKQFYKMTGGTWIDHVQKWSELNKQNKMHFSIVIRYEDMVNDPYSTFVPIAKALGKDSADLKNAIEIAFKKTSKNNVFFWKQKVGNYKDYLDDESIKRFMDKYKDILEQFGYFNEFYKKTNTTATCSQ